MVMRGREEFATPSSWVEEVAVVLLDWVWTLKRRRQRRVTVEEMDRARGGAGALIQLCPEYARVVISCSFMKLQVN
jgi:hypothetical protein